MLQDTKIVDIPSCRSLRQRYTLFLIVPHVWRGVGEKTENFDTNSMYKFTSAHGMAKREKIPQIMANHSIEAACSAKR